MARSFNQAIIMGNLTRDPELRTTPGGQQVASFAVATNRVWQGSDGTRQEAVDYHEVVAWGRLAELAGQYLGKGRKVLIVGRLQTRSWEGNDGVKRQRTEIIANDISFLDRPGDTPGGPSEAPAESSKATKSSKSSDVVIEDLGEDDKIDLNDIPF